MKDKLEVRSAMAATVLAIHVQPGDMVEPLATLLVVECMKMEIPVQASERGRVLEVRTEIGQRISENDVLMILEFPA